MSELPLPLTIGLKVLQLGDSALKDSQGRSAGFLRRGGLGSTETRVTGPSGDLLATLEDDNAFPQKLTRHKTTLFDASGQRIGLVVCANLVTSNLGRLRADVHDASGRLRFTFAADRLWLSWLREALEEVPGLDMAKSFFALPGYTLKRPDGSAAAKLVRLPALLDGSYRIEAVGALRGTDRTLATLALLALSDLELMMEV